MSEGDWLTIMEKTQDAVYAFAKAELASLTRRAIYRFQRVKASDVYGGDYKFKSLWDEYCHEVQNGPYDPLENAWDDVISRILDELVVSLPHETAVLLSIVAAHDLDEDVGAELIGSVWKEGIVRMLHDRLAEVAGGRDLEHLNPE